jgi:hypothetical protein
MKNPDASCSDQIHTIVLHSTQLQQIETTWAGRHKYTSLTTPTLSRSWTTAISSLGTHARHLAYSSSRPNTPRDTNESHMYMSMSMAAASPWWRRLPLLRSPSPAARKADLSIIDELIASEEELGFTESDELTSSAEVVERSPLLAWSQATKPTKPRRPQDTSPPPHHDEQIADIISSQPLVSKPMGAGTPSLHELARLKAKIRTKRALPLSHYTDREGNPWQPQPLSSLESIDFAGSATRLLYRAPRETIAAIRVVPRLVLILVSSLTLKFWIHAGLLVVFSLVVTRK